MTARRVKGEQEAAILEGVSEQQQPQQHDGWKEIKTPSLSD